jgi:Protein of unknown function (DUF3761)
MKRLNFWMVLSAGLLVSQICVAQAPAGAPAGATGICKDGTYSTSASKSGACRGHQGIQTWYAPAGEKAPSGKAATAPAATSAPAPVAKATPASTPAAAAKPTGAAPAGATGLCKDGTYSTSASKSGACRGHQGIQTWFAEPAEKATTAKQTAPAPAATPAPAPKPAQSSAPMVQTPAPASQAAPTRQSASNNAPAPGGGTGLVWVNTESNVYHCPGTQFYGKTKTGSYMSEADAKSKGARPDHGKPCK